MAVASDQNQIVLQDERGYPEPEVVIRNRSAGALELNKKAGVLLGGFARGGKTPTVVLARSLLNNDSFRCR